MKSLSWSTIIGVAGLSIAACSQQSSEPQKYTSCPAISIESKPSPQQPLSLEETIRANLSSLQIASISNYEDPNNAGNPLYIITNPNLQVAPNFTLGELATSGGQVQPYARISTKLVVNLQRLRDYVGEPVVVSSCYRSPERNKKVGGALKSRHMSGDAADIYVAGMSPHELSSTIEHLFGENIGLSVYEDGHVHVDFRGYKQRW
jgi:hypothetical protein